MFRARFAREGDDPGVRADLFDRGVAVVLAEGGEAALEDFKRRGVGDGAAGGVYGEEN